MTLPPHPSPAAPAAPPSIVTIFAVFARIGLLSFGGGLSGWVFREVVVLRNWIGEEEFLSGLALAQILPGTNIANLAVYIGQKLCGTAGAVAALGGLLAGPFFAVIALASVYDRFRSIPYADAAMDGVAAAAIGLLLIIVLRGVRHSARKPAGAIALAATFIGVGLLHVSLLIVVAVVGPLSVLAAWLGGRADA
ncbi:MAG TPA: chromate transporter [Pseudolabrys sp.]|nr:chromate transporter [Pseudolabrys sp.]